MNQSALTAGALLAGFALFLTARDRLSVYGAVLWGAKPTGTASADKPLDRGTSAPVPSVLTDSSNPMDVLKSFPQLNPQIDAYTKSLTDTLLLGPGGAIAN